MSASSSQPIPTALVTSIIEGFVEGIRPLMAFILIPTIFGSMFVPLLILLFALSTPQSRRKPIFILNVLFNKITDFIGLVLNESTPWFSEAVLLVRIAVVFSRRRLLLLLAFPIIIKVARFVVNVFFCVLWGKVVLRGFSNSFYTIEAFPRWLFPLQYFLELFDNSYVSFLFLWRLGLPNQSSFIEGTAMGRVTFDKSNQSYASKLQTLFWIAATNFIFPLIFGLIQIITAYRARENLLPQTVGLVNTYVAIISTVFATVWSSTSSLKEALAQNNPVVSGPLAFDIRQTANTMSHMPPAQPEENSGNVKLENWDEPQHSEKRHSALVVASSENTHQMIPGSTPLPISSYDSLHGHTRPIGLELDKTASERSLTQQHTKFTHAT
ncbi:hypothetical protein FB451DRAFT_1360475 [Mycena latifolia]|nr:hypothetical protein FB451DRAFT_1360475 [Mycena latifolia]